MQSPTIQELRHQVTLESTFSFIIETKIYIERFQTNIRRSRFRSGRVITNRNFTIDTVVRMAENDECKKGTGYCFAFKKNLGGRFRVCNDHFLGIEREMFRERTSRSRTRISIWLLTLCLE